MELSKYQEIKSAAERAGVEKERAVGAYQAALERLKEEWGCATLKEADAKLTEMRAKHDKSMEKLNAELAVFQKKWAHLLKK